MNEMFSSFKIKGHVTRGNLKVMLHEVMLHNATFVALQAARTI